MKTLALSSVLLTLLCTPSLAAPSAPPSNFQIDLVVRADGKPARTYSLRVTDGVCGQVKARVDDALDEIKVCTDDAMGAKLKMRIEWMLASKAKELNQTSVIVIERGAKFTLDSGSAKLDVAVL